MWAVQHIVDPALRPFVRLLWASAPPACKPAAVPATTREHVLPTGDMHLVFRLGGPPLRLFNGSGDRGGHDVGHAIVGGARSAFYAREAVSWACSVGAQLRPGAARALFGMPAHELSERHTRLDALWGPVAADCALQRLDEAGAADRCAVLRRLLVERLQQRAPMPLHPAVAQALPGLLAGGGIGALVGASGYSHRHFIALFRDSVGLAPQRLQSVLRIGRVLDVLGRDRTARWAELALRAGYSDQSHLHREFVSIVGMTPQAYRCAAPLQTRHVRVG